MSRPSAVTRNAPPGRKLAAALVVGAVIVLGLTTVALTVGIPIPVGFVTAGDKFPGEEDGGPGFEVIDKTLKP